MLEHIEKNANPAKTTSLRNGFSIDLTLLKFTPKKSTATKQLDWWKRFKARRCENKATTRDAKTGVWEGIVGLCRKNETVEGEWVCVCCTRKSKSSWLTETRDCSEPTWPTESWNSWEDWLLEADHEKEKSLGNHSTATSTEEVRGLAYEQWQELRHQLPATATSHVPARLGSLR